MLLWTRTEHSATCTGFAEFNPLTSAFYLFQTFAQNLSGYKRKPHQFYTTRSACTHTHL